MRTKVLLALLIAPTMGDRAVAQSLGDVARRTAERQNDTVAGRQYTNADLRVESPPATPAPQRSETSTVPASLEPGQAGISAPGEGLGVPARAAEKRDEAYWRDRARHLRSLVQKARAEAEAIEARVADLAAQRGQAADARERDVSAAAWTAQRSTVQFLTDELQRFEERARGARIPAEWVR